MRSPRGRAFIAVRENPIAAQAVGLSTRGVKTVAFTISAALAGAGGHLFAFFQGFISPEAFEFEASIFFLTTVIFGGAGTLAGPLVGAPIMTFLPEMLQRFVDFRLIIYGALIVASLYAMPLGIVGTVFRRATYLPDAASLPAGIAGAPVAVSQPAAKPASLATSATGDSIVAIEGVHMSFGGVRALNGIGFTVERGTIHALIGPNGAGKTVFSMSRGYYPPTEGRSGSTARSSPASPTPGRTAGVARTFQTAQLFGEPDGAAERARRLPRTDGGTLYDSALITPRLRREEAARRAAALGLLDFVGFQADPDALANSLPFGHQRLVEIARALAMEPNADRHGRACRGIEPEEVEDLDELITRISTRGKRRAAGGASHGLGDGHLEPRDRARLRREDRRGSPAEVQANPLVIEAYLGAEDDRSADEPAPIPA